MRVAYTGFFGDGSGYGEAARRTLAAFAHLEDVEVGPAILDKGARIVSDGGWRVPAYPTLRAFIEHDLSGSADVHLIHCAAVDFDKFRPPFMTARRIGMTCVETDTLHPKTIEGAKSVDAIWVPSQHNKEVFERAGLSATVVPYPLVIPPYIDEWDMPNRQAIVGLFESTYTFYCVTPDTRVLTADLRWVPAGDLAFGDKLIGFDEDCPPGEKLPMRRRKIQPARVVHTGRIRRPVYLLRLSDGTELKSSAEHPWLICTAGRKVHVWKTTKEIAEIINGGRRPQRARGSLLMCRFFKPWAEDRSYESGYAAALFDGEGHISFISPRQGRSERFLGGSFALGLSQKKGVVLSTIEEILGTHGFGYKLYPNPSGVQQLIIRGGWKSQAAVLGRYRPKRLLEKFELGFLAGSLPLSMYAEEKVKIESCEFLGEQEVVALETDTHTYFAEGYAAHNSICTFQERKNIVGLLAAFLYAFRAEDDVALLIKVAGVDAQQSIKQAAMFVGTVCMDMQIQEPPKIRLLGGEWTEPMLWGLHARGDCYVSLSRGEAFGIPMLDAAAVGNQVIAVPWGGQTDFLPAENTHWVRYRMTPVMQRYPHFNGYQLWADADVLDAARAMQRLARRGRTPKIVPDLSLFSTIHVANLLHRALNE